MEKHQFDISSESDRSCDPLLRAEATKAQAFKKERGHFSGWVQLSVFAVFTLYTVFSLPFLAFFVYENSNLPYSPAKEFLRYERRKLYSEKHSPYAGSPDIVESAWDNLLTPVNIRASRHELLEAQSDFDGLVQLVDGDFVAVLGVYHELHCLNALRKNIHHDYYYPNITAEHETWNVDHMIHCIDSIRRSLMCRADIALYGAFWIGSDSQFANKEVRSNTESVCIDWDAIDAWSRQRLLARDQYSVRPGPFERKP